MGKLMIVRSLTFSGYPSEESIRWELENMVRYKSGRTYREVSADWKTPTEKRVFGGEIYLLVRNSAAREFFSSDIFSGNGEGLPEADRCRRKIRNNYVDHLDAEKVRSPKKYRNGRPRYEWWGYYQAHHREVICKPDYIGIFLNPKLLEIEEIETVVRVANEYGVPVYWHNTRIVVDQYQIEKIKNKINKRNKKRRRNNRKK